MLLTKVSLLLRELVYPSLCAVCSSMIDEGRFLCPQCYCAIKPIASRCFPLTAKHALYVHAVGAYEGAMATLVKRKFYGQLFAPIAMARLMYELLPPSVWEVDFLVPIPLHWTRYARRGFNQSVEMACQLSVLTGVPVAHVLKRRKRTAFQFGLSAAARQQNVEAAFELRLSDEQRIAGKSLLLIDDLCTTGATLVQTAKVLLKMKPQNITAAVTARALVF